MKPPLSPAHGTSLGTTAGITAVISVVVALSLLGQCNALDGAAVLLASGAAVALVLGAGALYAGRNDIGRALDMGASDATGAGIAAARGLVRFHLGIAAVFAGCGAATAFRLSLPHGGAAWLVPAVAAGMSAWALASAVSWWRELARRRRA